MARRVWALVVAACGLWVLGQALAAAVAGRAPADPAAALLAADLEQAGALAAGPRPGAVAVMAPATGSLRVTLLSQPRAPRAVLLVNARAVVRFTGPEVTVAVAPGDLVEIDGSAYRQTLTFRVAGLSPDLAAPPVGTLVATRGDIAVLGRVAARTAPP
jgi:hypothetical protein